MNYSYGLSIINTHLQIGATLIMNSYPISSREFWDYAKKTKATSMGGVPFTYEVLSKFTSKFVSESSLRKFTQAGGKLSREKVLEIFELVDGIGGTFTVMYGQTEATARISFLPHKLIKRFPESIGTPIPKGEIVLVDEFGEEISVPFQTGELRYVGPNVCLGYAERLDDLYSPDNNNGSLDTGDLAYVDGDGLFFITGRKSRFVKLFGVRTNLDDIERALSQAGFTCVCQQKNDRLLIFTTEVEMLQQINDYVKSLYKLPLAAFSTIAIKSIPRNDSGKVLYANLLEEVEA
jgi:acyl-coenzyme A synthetase/AMP-(fatty) acid ligase